MRGRRRVRNRGRDRKMFSRTAMRQHRGNRRSGTKRGGIRR